METEHNEKQSVFAVALEFLTVHIIVDEPAFNKPITIVDGSHTIGMTLTEAANLHDKLTKALSLAYRQKEKHCLGK